MNYSTAMRALSTAVDELKHLGGRTAIVENAADALDWLAGLFRALANEDQGGDVEDV